jgi:hypothetical protein
MTSAPSNSEAGVYGGPVEAFYRNSAEVVPWGAGPGAGVAIELSRYRPFQPRTSRRTDQRGFFALPSRTRIQ